MLISEKEEHVTPELTAECKKYLSISSLELCFCCTILLHCSDVIVPCAFALFQGFIGPPGFSGPPGIEGEKVSDSYLFYLKVIVRNVYVNSCLQLTNGHLYDFSFFVLFSPNCQDAVRQCKFEALIYSFNVLRLWEKMWGIYLDFPLELCLIDVNDSRDFSINESSDARHLWLSLSRPLL